MSKEKIRNALDRYYKAFDYDDGTLAYKRGGQMGFGKKFYLGGDEDEDEVSDEGLGAGENGSKSWKDIFDFSDTKWGGLAGTAVGLIGDTVGGFRDMADKNAQLERSVNQYGTGAFNNVYDNTSLLSAIGNTYGLSNISKSDIRDKTVGQDIGSAFSTGLSAGLSTGNVFVGIGAGLLDAGKSIAQRLKAKSYADRVNQYIKDKNIQLNKQAFMASQGVDAHNDWMRMMSYYMNPYDYALGGEMRTHGANFNNGLTFINEGGTHEQNPYEGVPSGVDDEGTPNLVEEGEVIWDNEYVFSNRIKIPKHLAKKYKLGGNLTFADAIKEVTKESLTRPNDPISNETNKAIVNEFMDEQEVLREREQQSAARQLQTAYDEDFMEQMEMMNATQQVPPTPGAVNYQDPTIAQEGMPMGFAGGGEKGVPKHPSVPYDIYIPDDTNNPKSIADRTRQFANVLAYYEPLMQAVRDIPGYYKYSAPGREVLDKAYQPYNESAREHTRLMLLRQAAEAEKQLSNVKALGGNKFQNGSWKNYVTEGKDSAGVTIYTTSDGQIFYSEAGAKKYVDLNREALISRLPDFTPSPAASRVVAERPESGLPEGIQVIYSKGRNGSRGPATQYILSDGRKMGTNRERAIEEQNKINGTYSQEQPQPQTSPTQTTQARRASVPTVLQRPVEEPQTAPISTSTVRTVSSSPATNTTSAATNDNPIEYVYSRDGSQFLGYRIKGQKGRYGSYEAAVAALPEKERAKITIQQAQPVQNQEVPNTVSRNVPDYQMQMLADLDAALSNPAYYGERPTQGNTQNGPIATVPLPSVEDIDEGSAPEIEGKVPVQKPRYSGRTGSVKNTRARDAENNPQYKSLVESMDKASAEDKKKFIDELNAGLPEGKKIKDFSTWRRKATDGEWGSVHEATVNYINKQPAEVAPAQPVVEGAPETVQAQDPNPFTNPFTRTVAQLILDGTLKVPQIPTQATGTSTSTTEQEQPVNPVNPKGTTGKYRSGIDLARLAPLIGTGIMAGKSIVDRPNYANADAIIEAARLAGAPVNIPVQTIGDYMAYKPFDERYLVNMANQNRAAAARGITNTAGGNRAMDLLGNMSLAHNNQQELGEIARQAYLANQQQRSAVAEFNRGTNVQNMSAINQRNLAQAQLNSQRQATALSGLARGYGMREDVWRNWRDDRDANIEAFLENVGTWGRERESDSMAYSLARELGYNYTWNPKTKEYEFVKTTAKGGNKKKRRF